MGDIMKKVVNEYVFDYPMIKRFYQVNLQTRFYLILLFLVLFSAVSSFLDNDLSFGIFSLVIFVFGCIYYFFFPIFLAKKAYQTFTIQSGGKDVRIRVSVTSKEIVVENIELKRKDTYSLEIVKSVRKNKDVFCLYTKEKVAILFANKGFVKGDKEVLYSLIEDVKNNKCN